MQATLDMPQVRAHSAAPAPPARHARSLAWGVLLLAYFAYFSRNTLAVHFAPDEMMNLATYWRIKPLRLLLAQFMLWRPYYRPMGGLLDRALFHAFGLNPAPYHAALLVILFANVCLTCYLARLLGGSRITAGLAAMIVSYHAGINNLYYNTAFTYDALCCCFYLAALVCYVRIRARGVTPGARAIAAVLLLYVCALNSKEMAVTFPAILLAYEWLYQRFRPNGHGVLAWLRGPGRTAAAAACLALIFCYGHVLRPGGLMDSPAYRPALSWARFVDFQIRSLGDLLIRPRPLDLEGVAAIWIALTYLAWRRNRPILQFCWCFVALAPLPIEFLQGRAGACLAIPCAGLAIFAAVVAVDLAHAAAGFLAEERAFRRLSRSRLFAAVVLLGASQWAWHNADLQIRYIQSSMRELGQPTWDAIQQLRALHPVVHPNASVVFLRDPFHGFDMEFIAELFFRDQSVIVRLAREIPVSPEKLARAERVFDYRDGRLVQVR